MMKIWDSNDMCLSIVLLLICSFASLNHGAPEFDLSQQHTHIEEVAKRSFEIDDHIIDCINIYKQPAFQHPLLINHTLQLKPNYPGETNDYISKASTPKDTSKSCPDGSIPIERMQRNGHFGDNLFENHTVKHPPHFLPRRGLQQRNSDQLNAYSTIEIFNEKYYGVKATLNVWHPNVEQENGYSASQVWLVGGDSQNVLEAGWMVHPNLYDSQTRFFIYWTADQYNHTGCYNIHCPGFVHTNQQYSINSYLHPVSVYDGEQRTIDLEIFRDTTTGNWWLRLQRMDMGYWPKELVPLLDEGANVVSLGGAVTYFLPGPRTGTEMGSGHFSAEDNKKSAFIRNIQVLDTNNQYKNPPDFDQVTLDRGCYDMHVIGDTGGSWGQFLYYGGPGRSETCI